MDIPEDTPLRRTIPQDSECGRTHLTEPNPIYATTRETLEHIQRRLIESSHAVESIVQKLSVTRPRGDHAIGIHSKNSHLIPMDLLSVLHSAESQAQEMMALLRRCWSQSYLVRTLVSPDPDEPATDEIMYTHGWADQALSAADYYAGLVSTLATMDIFDIHIRDALASLGHVEHRLVVACSDLMWKFSNLLARTLHLETRRLIRFTAAKTNDSIRNAQDPHQGPRPTAEQARPVRLATEDAWTESEWSRPASPSSP